MSVCACMRGQTGSGEAGSKGLTPALTGVGKPQSCRAHPQVGTQGGVREAAGRAPSSEKASPFFEASDSGARHPCCRAHLTRQHLLRASRGASDTTPGCRGPAELHVQVIATRASSGGAPKGRAGVGSKCTSPNLRGNVEGVRRLVREDKPR